jgi:hypothetical protein
VLAVAPWFLEQEARALLARLRGLRPFALQETMLPAAAITPRAQVEIEQFLVKGRLQLAAQVREYIRWLRGAGRQAPPALMQRRYALLRVRFNEVLSELDEFSDALTQRSEHETGVFLSALDALAADAMQIPDSPFALPEVITLQDRGPGGSIRRARTRLPSGPSPVAIVRVPRERLVGFGVGASLGHECGHQVAALLDLIPSLRPSLAGMQRSGSPRARAAWTLFNRWLGEALADLWAVGKLGISASLGLMAVISLPPYFVHRQNTDDPHPYPWVRLKLSCAFGEALFPPHQALFPPHTTQWRELAGMWEQLYPPSWIGRRPRAALAALEEAMPGFVALLVDHRPRSLRGRSLRDVLPTTERTPQRLSALFHAWRVRPAAMRSAAPTLAIAVLGQARANGELSPELESRTLRSLLTYWALQTSVNRAEESTRRMPRRTTRRVLATTH